MDGHRVFLEPRIIMRCGSCGEEFSDFDAAKKHVFSSGGKTLVEASDSKMYPCGAADCDRSFSSEQGLAIHRARVHDRTGPH